MPTTNEILDMQPGPALDLLVAKALGQTDFTHLPFQYVEGVTEDGKDGWDGFCCPRCRADAGSSYKNPCVKPYSADLNLAWREIVFKANAGGPWNIWLSFDASRTWSGYFEKIVTLRMTGQEVATQICKAFLLAKEQDAYHTRS